MLRIALCQARRGLAKCTYSTHDVSRAVSSSATVHSASSPSQPASDPATGLATAVGGRPPLPPFTEQTAKQKVQMAEDAWNTRDPERVSLAYTQDCEWRNRAEFLKGRDAIREFLRRKWHREQGYRLRKYLWAFTDNHIAVCFEYEYHDASGQWHRAYGNENWEFDQAGLMRKRIASINEAPIQPHERRIAVDGGQGPLHNAWLAEQGLSGMEGFPFGGGSEPSYQ